MEISKAMGREQRRNIASKVLWIISIAVIFFIGVYYFPKEYKNLELIESIYYTIRLFVLEHDLPSFPKTWPLIVIHFAAPLVAVSAGWYFLKYLFVLKPFLKIRGIRDHVVVCGMGKAGRLITSALEKRSIKVIGIDRGPVQRFEDWFREHRSPILIGDFNSHVLLKRARATRARTLVFATGDDLANLEGAVAAYDQLKTDVGPVRLIWIHIANEKLANTAREVVRTRGVVGIRFFDTYRIAAAKVIREYFPKEERGQVTEVNIIGFGKFGRDLAELLLTDRGAGENFKLNIIDILDKQKQVAQLACDFGLTPASGIVSFVQQDISDLHLIDDCHKAFFICTDDDLGNLTAAMSLARKVDCSHIYVRMTTWPVSAVAEHLGEDRGLYFININELVSEGLSDLPGLFLPPNKSHLKRTSERQGEQMAS